MQSPSHYINLAVILLSLSCFGQAFTMQDTAWLGNVSPAVATSTPSLNDVTNLAGYPVWAFYQPSAANYVTNGGKTVQLADLWTNAFHLTNSQSGASAKWPLRQSAALNGYDTLLFSTANATYLKNLGYSNTPPIDVWMVMRWNAPTNGTAAYIFDGANSGGRDYEATTSSGLLPAPNSTSNPVDFAANTNKWMVWEFVFSSTATAFKGVYTNNVLATSISTGAGGIGMWGLEVGAAYNSGSASPIDVAMIVVYGSTNITAIPGTNTTARAQVFSALTNYFSLSP